MNLDAEKYVIGCLLLKPHLLAELTLQADDFQAQSMREVFSTIIKMTKSGAAVDAFTVSEHMGDQSKLAVLGRIAKDVPSTANVVAYAQIIIKAKKLARAREIGFLLTESEDDVTAIAQKQLMDLCTDRKNSSQVLAEILPGVIEDIGSQATSGISTGLADLDRITGGVHKSDLIVIAARPAMGKTALMLNIAHGMNAKIGIFSLEQPRKQLAQRLICLAGNVSGERIRHGELRENEFQKVADASSKLMAKPIHIDDRGVLKIDDIVSTARRWKWQHDVDAIFIDYVQKIRGDNRIARTYQLEDVVSSLKSLAKELDIAVIALAQVNRKVEERTRPIPLMGDIKDSGAIEQEADQIIALYRDEVYHANTTDAGIAELYVLKNRHGSSNKGARVSWRQEYMKFENLRAVNHSGE